MVTKTAARPTPQPSHSHSVSLSHRPSSKTSTPLTPAPPRAPPSVGQALPPNVSALLRSPAGQEARSSSPNYFGLAIDPAIDHRESGAGPKENWSPPSSSIRSYGPSSPRHIPLDTNPDLDAFRKHTEDGHGFHLSHGNFSNFASTPSAHVRPKRDQRASRSEAIEQFSPRSKPAPPNPTPDRMDIDGGLRKSFLQPSYSDQPSFFDIPRQQSPSNYASPTPPIARNTVSRLDDRHPRNSLPQNKADPPSPHERTRKLAHQRADTLPVSLDEGPVMIAPNEFKNILDRVPSSQCLLLDLRVFPQYQSSRIHGALNLCIPTTLLKRPSFNLKKLQETFSNEIDKKRFSDWKDAKCIVVYDASSDTKKDATSAVNTFKKFTHEGWQGSSYILKGGFTTISKEFPALIESRPIQDVQSSKINLSLGTGPEVAPVAGGCSMPATKNPANPFFSNVRQNQDLIDGVGQMDLELPDGIEDDDEYLLPAWLLKAAERDDHGKRVSDKFLRLERAEQSRMTKALSSGVAYGTPAVGAKDVQIAGIEKGGKNRYNNIWPFEHARVRLQGRPEGSCDYVNASHIKASRSNKQYIASQGPLPATFEDFWSVIWDHDVRVIVMLTAESEGGQLKCHSYWKNKNYGPLKLVELSEKKVSLGTKRHRSPMERHESLNRRRAITSADVSASRAQPETPHAIVRKFTMSHAAHPFSPMREITQIHYSSWPDFGAPASPGQLLGLVELTNHISRESASSTHLNRSDEPESDENARPVLVHCSAGCGRTGTFCTIDTVIDMLKRQRKEMKNGVTPMEIIPSGDDYLGKMDFDISRQWVFDQTLDLVEKTVDDFRGQRLSMVQSLRQYVLCYETILEWISQQQFGNSGKTRERKGSDPGLERPKN